MTMKKRLAIAGVMVGVLTTGGAAMATFGFGVQGGGGAQLSCPGGMTRLGHVLDESASVFPDDPPTHIELWATIPDVGFQVERIDLGVHTGTHIDAPGHFFEGARTIDDLEATEFVWPAYVIDVRDRMTGGDSDGEIVLSPADIKAYEKAHGKIRPKSMVIIQTGFDAKFGTPDYDAATPGFSAEAVQWMVDNRNIGGVGSDTYGPDATSDPDFGATSTILENDRVAMPGINDVDSLSIRDDIIIASAVPLRDGSAYQTDPLACHGRTKGRDSDRNNDRGEGRKS